MDKVSSILPSNPRITSVDMDEAPGARPGSPTVGRKAGANSVRDRATISADAKEMAAKETLLGKKGVEASRAKAVEAINRKFFETRLQPVEKVGAGAPGVSEDISEKINESVAEEAAPQINDEMLAKYEPKTVVAPRVSIEA